MTWWQALSLVTAAVLFLAIAHGGTLHNGFHFDDAHVIERNAWIRDLAFFPRWFTDATTFSVEPRNQTYRPLVTLTLALDWWRARGMDPVPYHVTQLALLAACCALLGSLARRVFTAAGATLPLATLLAGVAATLFGVHVGNTQTVNYISARSELLAGLGILGAFATWLAWPAARRWQLPLLPMALGALAKPPAVLFAPLLVAWLLCWGEEPAGGTPPPTGATFAQALRRAFPALVVGVVLFAFVEHMNPPSQSYGGGARSLYLATQSWVWVRYLALFVLPVDLSADHDLQIFTSWGDPRTLVGVVVIALLAVVTWRAWRTPATRPIAFGLAWFAITLLPTSSIIPLAEVTNDHRVFLPFMGLVIAVTWAGWLSVESLAAARPAAPVRAMAAALVVAVLLVHAAGSRARGAVWRDEATLWGDVVQKSPRNGRGLMNYALTLMARGQYAEALRHFERAAVLNPNYATLEVNLAIVKGAMGRDAEAERHFERASRLEPEAPSSYLYHARWLVQRGRGREALPLLARAAALAPGDLEGRREWLVLLAASGDSAAAQRVARESVALLAEDWLVRALAGVDDAPASGAPASGAPASGAPASGAPASERAWVALGLARAREGRWGEAAVANRVATRLAPRAPDAWVNLGWALLQLGFGGEAVAAYDRALVLQPDDPVARHQRTLALAARGDARVAAP